jgi:hypothetical protein
MYSRGLITVDDGVYNKILACRSIHAVLHICVADSVVKEIHIELIRVIQYFRLTVATYKLNNVRSIVSKLKPETPEYK